MVYSKHNDQTYKYTNFPSYDYTIVAIPENTDLSFQMNQARLAHEMTHGAVHFGMKQMKYSQRFIDVETKKVDTNGLKPLKASPLAIAPIACSLTPK
mgnify:CR=1 FL=1